MDYTKIGEFVTFDSPNGKESTGKVIGMYTGLSGAKMATVEMGFVTFTHVVEIGVSKIKIKPVSGLIVDPKIIKGELVKDNESLMLENDRIVKENTRLLGIIDFLNSHGRQLIEEKTELRAQVSMLKKGLVLK